MLSRIRAVLQRDGLKELIRKAIFTFILKTGYALSESLFQRNDVILFGDRLGKEYGGNSRYLYEYVLQHEPAVKPVWMTKDKTVIEQLQSENKPVADAESFRSIVTLLRAKVLLFTHSSLDVLPVHMYPSATTNIHLGHGHPVKYDQKPGPVSKYEQKRNGIDYFIVESEFLRDVHRDRYPVEISEDCYLITGYPRNDVLFDPPEEWHTRWNDFLDQKPFRVESTILYAPTQRQPAEVEAAETVDLFPFDDFDLEQLEQNLNKTNSLLFVKLHPSDDENLRDLRYQTKQTFEDLSEFIDRLSEIDRIEYVSREHRFSEPNELLPFVDVLITDYSSIYHDYLLLDRPILFIPYDYEAFKRDFGFGYDYFKVLPGPDIDSFDEFLEQLNGAVQGQKANAKQRRELREKLHKYHDGDSCQRTWEAICGVSEISIKRGN